MTGGQYSVVSTTFNAPEWTWPSHCSWLNADGAVVHPSPPDIIIHYIITLVLSIIKLHRVPFEIHKCLCMMLLSPKSLNIWSLLWTLVVQLVSIPLRSLFPSALCLITPYLITLFSSTFQHHPCLSSLVCFPLTLPANSHFQSFSKPSLVLVWI